MRTMSFTIKHQEYPSKRIKNRELHFNNTRISTKLQLTRLYLDQLHTKHASAMDIY